MMPARFVCVDEIPVLPNGKIDARRIPVRHDLATVGTAVSEIERVLLRAWCEVLGLPDVGVDDNFFDVGGHSLLLTQLIFRIREAFRVELPLRVLFDARTIVDMTVAITEKQVEAENPDDVVQMLRELRGLSPEEIKVLLEEDSAI